MDDETRAWLRRLFDDRDHPPADVVPARRLTPAERREHYLHLNGIAGTWAEVTIPGEVILDADGWPVGFEAPRTETVHRDAAVTVAELEVVGLTPEDVPNLTVWEPPRGPGQCA